MTKEVYDSMVQAYQEVSKSIKRRETLERTLFEHIGDVRGKSVLDLGCGEGYCTRKIKISGAGNVVGVDVSPAMLELARKKEEQHPLGIVYEQFNIARLPQLGSFDLATAAYLLHYSKSKEELFSMCHNIFTNLKSGGRFISLNLDPVNPLQPDQKYDSTIVANGPLEEGSTVKVTLFVDDRPICSFDNYFWNKATYDEAFKSAGFIEVKWHPIKVSNDGVERYGEAFWENYLRQPGVIAIECCK